MDNEEFMKLWNERKGKQAEVDSKKGAISKERLYETAGKRMTTCFVGALDALEKRMGFLWESGDTESQREMKRIYSEIRKDIFDIGNEQKKLFKEDLENYDVHFNQYSLVLPVVDQNDHKYKIKGM